MFKEVSVKERILKAAPLLYYPSEWSVAVPCALVGVSVLLLDWWARTNNCDSNTLANLIALESGLTTIIFPLILFIIESTGDRSEIGVKKSEVILKDSFLFPVAISALAALFGFAFIKTQAAAIAILILTTGTSMFALYRIVKLLLDDYRLTIAGRELLKDKVRRSIDKAIKERLANNILAKQQDALGIKFFSLGREEDDSALVFDTDRRGEVVDVDLGILREFATLVQRFYAPAIGTPAAPEAEVSEDSRSREDAPVVYFLGRPGAVISDRRRGVLAVDKLPGLQAGQQKALAELARRAVITGESENFAKVLRTEVNKLKSFMLSAIAERHTGSIEIAVEHYKAIAEAFLEELAKINSTYSSERAREEISSLMGGWSEVDFLDEDVHEFISRAAETDSVDVIHEVSYLPVTIAITALKTGDHYVFRRFIKYCKDFYLTAYQVPEGRVRGFLLDRSRRNLREVSDYFIEPELLRKKIEVERLESYRDFALEVLLVFQSLAKAAMDRRDVAGLPAIVGDINSLLTRFHPDSGTHALYYIDAALASQDISEARRAELTRIRPLQAAREDAARAIRLRKRQILFGLAAWGLKQFERQPADTAVIAMLNFLLPQVH